MKGPDKTALRLGLGALVSLLAIPGLPLADGDPLRGTLAFLPLLIAGFTELDVRIRAAGGRRISPLATGGELAALTGLVLAALIRPWLGLPERCATVIFCGLLLVLGHRVLHEVPRLRPLLGSRLPRRPHVAFFLLPWLVYLAILPWSTSHHPPDGDEPYYLLITHSLAYDLDADLTNNYARNDAEAFLDRPLEPQLGDPVGPAGQLYSRHNALLPLVLAPAYRLAGLAGALVGMTLLAAALAWATLKLGRHYVAELPGPALVAYALVAFASPLVLYSYQVWVEVPATLLSVWALDQILALRPRRTDGEPVWGRKEWLGIGLPILLLPLVKLRFMLVAGPLLVLAWWHAGRPRKPLLVLAGLLSVVGGGLLIHNEIVYDNPLKIHSMKELELYRYTAGDFLEGAFGLFYDSAFGLFGAFPIWLLLLPAAAFSLARRQRILLDLAVLTGPYLLIVVPRSEWYGGWSPPFRYALIALPLLGLVLAPLLRHRRGGGARALVAALGLATLSLGLLWLAVPGWTYNFADGSTYLLNHVSDRLGADAIRLFPSTIRPRPATWIWILATAVLVPLLWWRPRRLPGATSWGAGGLLLTLALVPPLASNLPTRVVEIEDGQVLKDGGHLFPFRWIPERTLYRGGWVLRQGERLVIPVVPGGDEGEVRVLTRLIRNEPGPLPFEIRLGDRVLGRFDAGAWEPGWRQLTFGPLEWSEEAPLVIEAGRVPGPLNGVAFDRLELTWHESLP